MSAGLALSFDISMFHITRVVGSALVPERDTELFHEYSCIVYFSGRRFKE